jgi:hypothetical protein
MELESRRIGNISLLLFITMLVISILTSFRLISQILILVSVGVFVFIDPFYVVDFIITMVILVLAYFILIKKQFLSFKREVSKKEIDELRWLGIIILTKKRVFFLLSFCVFWTIYFTYQLIFFDSHDYRFFWESHDYISYFYILYLVISLYTIGGNFKTGKITMLL